MKKIWEEAGKEAAKVSNKCIILIKIKTLLVCSTEKASRHQPVETATEILEEKETTKK